MSEQERLTPLRPCRHPGLGAILGIVVLAVAPPLATIELPAQLPPDMSHLAVELDNADLTIVLEAGAEEVITATPTSDGAVR